MLFNSDSFAFTGFAKFCHETMPSENPFQHVTVLRISEGFAFIVLDFWELAGWQYMSIDILLSFSEWTSLFIFTSFEFLS